MTVLREQAVQSVRTRLERRVSPRLHMLGLVTVTGGAGFIASFLLLHAGVRSMAIRYPLATGIAYGVFLGLVWIWLRRFRLTPRRGRTRERNDFDVDVTDLPLKRWFSSTPDQFGFGGGGGFSGGGGGTEWTDAPTVNTVSTIMPGGDFGSASGGGWDLDLDEGALWLIPIAIIAAVVLSVVVYMLFVAPVFFAELLLDAGLAAGLYRTLLRAERRSWLRTALRNTAIPVCFVAALLAVAGTIMQEVYPDAVSIGVVVRHLKESRAEHAKH
jgi:hypothetical protein